MANLLMLTVGLLGGSLGALGLYMGYKLSRLRRHKGSEEIQTVFRKTNLN
jgi:hypothetical protein